MTLRDLTFIINGATLGNSVPAAIVLPFETWDELRVQAGCWWRPDVAFTHFLWQGIPITYYEEMEAFDGRVDERA